jgi:Domain of unknown function (DUF4911)
MKPDDRHDGGSGVSASAGAMAGDPPGAMASMLIAIAPEQIALFKALIESYDNLATMRTEDPARHHLRLYFAPESAADFSALIEALTAQFAIRRIE